MDIFFNTAKHILHWGKRTGLILSSLFFATLFWAVIFFQQHSQNIIFVFLLMLFFVFILTLSKKLMEKVFREHIVNLTGSIAFAIFVISKYFFENSLFAKTFITHQAKLEFFFNLSLVTVLLHSLLFVFVFVGVPVLLLSIVGYLHRLSNNHFWKLFMKGAEYLCLCIIIIIIVGYTASEDSWLDNKIMSSAPLLVPFLGFSLLYIHLEFLIKSILRYLGFYINDNHDIKAKETSA